MNKSALCWIDGEIMPAVDARISVFDHGLLYGDGVFEGLRFYHRRVFREQAHLQRLQQSAAAIGLELPCDAPELSAAIAALIEGFEHADGYLRLVVTRGPGSLGIDPRSCAKPVVFIIADELRVMDVSDPRQGVSLHVASVRRMPASCLDPRIKSLNYLNNILARIEANRAGADEALMLNLDGNISEGSVDNLFIASQGRLLTPPLSDGLLAGITRDVVIEVARERGIECSEVSLRLDALYAADECFLTGTGAELIPVRRVGEHEFRAPRNPVTPDIMRAFRERIDLECASG